MEIRKGKINLLMPAVTKNGKNYYKLVIDKTFIFVWNNLKIVENLVLGDYVEFDYTERNNFKSLSFIKKVDEPIDICNDGRYDKYLEFFVGDNVRDEYEYCDELCYHFGIDDDSVIFKIIDEMKDRGLIIEVGNGMIKKNG